MVNCFAVMMAGGGYVPVDPQWPLQRQLHVVEAVSASFVLLGAASNDADAGSRLAELKSIAQEKGINLMTVEELENAEDAVNSCQEHTEADLLIPDLAYVLFTSGTSGKPKGVQVTASNLAAFLQGALACILNRIAGAAGARLRLRPSTFRATTFSVLSLQDRAFVWLRRWR